MIKIALSGIAGLAIGAYAASSPLIATRHNDETVKAVSIAPIDPTELTRQTWNLPVVEVKEPF